MAEDDGESNHPAEVRNARGCANLSPKLPLRAPHTSSTTILSHADPSMPQQSADEAVQLLTKRVRAISKKLRQIDEIRGCAAAI